MKIVSLPALLLVAALAGCEPTPILGPKAPHDGTLLPLPDQKGYAEFVKRDVEGQPDQVRFVVYFLTPDYKPVPTPPTSATFKPTGRGAKSIDLKASGDADGSLSGPPLANTGEIDGELATSIDGKPVAIPIKAR